MPYSSKRKAKQKAKNNDPKTADDEINSEDGKESSETSFHDSPGGLASPNALFGEDRAYEFLDPKLVKMLCSVLPDSFQVVAEQLNSLPQIQDDPTAIVKVVLEHFQVLEDMISEGQVTTKELCSVYRYLPKAADDTTSSSYHPNPKEHARFKELVKTPTLSDVRVAFECPDGSSLLKQPWNTASERRLEALVRESLTKTEFTVAEALLLNYDGVAHARGIVLVQGDTLSYGSDDVADYFADPLSSLGTRAQPSQSSIVGLRQLSKFELAHEYLRFPFHVPSGRISLAQHHALDFLDKMFSSSLKTRETKLTHEARELAAQWVIVQECVRSIFQMISTVIHEEIPRASWAQTLAIQDLPVGLPLQQIPEIFSYSSPVISVLKREFTRLTYGSRARGAFYEAKKGVNNFGGLNELSAVTAHEYVGQGAIEFAFIQQGLTLEARDCAVPLPKVLADRFLHGNVVHPGTSDIVSLQACVFQLVKATQLSADKFTVSEIKAVKRVENAWINGEIDSFPSLLSLFTDIEAAGDLRAVTVPWNSQDGSSANSSGFLGSSSLEKHPVGGRDGGDSSSSRPVGGQDGGDSYSSSQFKSKYQRIRIPSSEYPGKVSFVAESLSPYDFSKAFDFVDTGSYCGKTWRAKLDGPRLELTSFSGARAYQALGTFGALKFAQRPMIFRNRNSSDLLDNPTYIAELAHAKLLPFKPHPATPDMNADEEADATKMFRELRQKAQAAKSAAQNNRGAAEPSKTEKKALVATQNAQRHRDQKAEEQKELQAMIMAAVSAGTLELKGSLGSLQGELQAQRTELDRHRSFLGYSHVGDIGGGGGGGCAGNPGAGGGGGGFFGSGNAGSGGDGGGGF